MLNAIFIPFVSIFFAELFDKSQISLLLLSSKTKKHSQLLFGSVLAFAIIDGSAILLGSFINNLVPGSLIKIISSGLFILFGVLSFRTGRKEKIEDLDLQNPFLTSFSLILFSEMGDKTQIASGVFGSNYPPLLVFAGVMSALILLSILSLLAGSLLFKKVKKQTISIFSGIIFIVIGLLFLFIK